MDFSAEFKRKFKKFIGQRIAIYGIGVNAERIFSAKLPEFDFSAVVDDFHAGEEIFGRRITTTNEAINIADIIIIAATPRSTRLVFSRIDLIVKDIIPIYDLRGNQLNRGSHYSEYEYWKCNKDGLKEKILSHDIISFDIFDTLLMRKVLFPKDVFVFMEEKLKSESMRFGFLAESRIKAEQIASKENRFATIDVFYKELVDANVIDERDADRLKEFELQTEMELLIPRFDMLEMFNFAKTCGKIVCITSDMYLPKKYMEPLLKGNAIDGYDDLFISCEQYAAKYTGDLFVKLKKKYKGKKILHIGDNEYADVKMAKKNGISTFQVMSSYEMLLMSSVPFLADKADSFADRMLLGNIIAEYLNSPFKLAEHKGKVFFDNISSLARFCFAGFTMRYIAFIMDVVKKSKEALVMFVSRDGYLLYKIYEQINTYTKKLLPKAVYFYSSRQAATNAVCKDLSDIKILCSDLKKSEMIVEKMLRQRFSLDTNKEEYNTYKNIKMNECNMDNLYCFIESHKEEIFRKAKICRDKYNKYLKKLNLSAYRNIYMVDLVTRGTVAYALARIIERDIHLIACGTLNAPNQYIDDENKFSSLYGNFTPTSDMSDLFPLFELIFASKEGQLKEFDEEGRPEFVPGSEYDPILLDEIQEEVMSCVKEFLVIPDIIQELSTEFTEGLLKVVRQEYSEITPDIVDRFKFTDPLSTMESMNILKELR